MDANNLHSIERFLTSGMRGYFSLWTAIWRYYLVGRILAFVAAARAVWAVAKDREDPERRLLLPVKCNLGPDQSGLAYRVVPVDDVACIEWEPDPVDVDLFDVSPVTFPAYTDTSVAVRSLEAWKGDKKIRSIDVARRRMALLDRI